MPKYNETNVVGESWIRPNRVMFSSKYKENATISYQEEEILNVSENEVIKTIKTVGSNLLTETFTADNSNTSFELINPETELPTGNTATYQDLYILIHSLYFHLAEKRDKGTKPFPSWIWSDETNSWLAPIQKPEVGNWIWDEEFQQWAEQP